MTQHLTELDAGGRVVNNFVNVNVRDGPEQKAWVRKRNKSCCSSSKQNKGIGAPPALVIVDQSQEVEKRVKAVIVEKPSPPRSEVVVVEKERSHPRHGGD